MYTLLIIIYFLIFPYFCIVRLRISSSTSSSILRLEELWEAELKKSGTSGASLFRVFIRFIKKRWLVASLVLVISLGLLLFSVVRDLVGNWFHKI